MSEKFEIRVKKDCKNGELGYEIISVSALTKGKLPSDYIGEAHPGDCFAYYDSRGSIYVNRVGGEDCRITPGMFYSVKHLNHILEMLENAGERLKDINDQIRKEEKLAAWSGEETIVI